MERATFALIVFALLGLVVVSRENDYAKWREMLRNLSRKIPSRAIKKKVRLTLFRWKRAVIDNLFSLQILVFDEPQTNFRSNLREDLAYVTGFPYGGLSESRSRSLRPE